MYTQIIINGHPIPPGKLIKWNFNFADLVKNSNRVGGNLMRFNFIATKVQWEAEFTMLTKTELEELLGAIQSVPFFPIQCYDPLEKDVVTKTFYKSDRSGETLRWFSSIEGYFKLSVTFIQE